MSDVALRFGAKDDGLSAQFRKINDQLDDFKDRAGSASSAVGTIFKSLAGLAAVAGFAKLTGEALEFADAQKKMQAQTGLSTDATQRLSFIAGQTSVDIGTLTGGVLKLQKVLGGFEEGSDKSAAALGRLGLATASFTNLNPEEQFNAVAQAISGLATQNEKVVATTELFGKSGAELLPVLDAIGTQSAELDAKLASIGGPVGQEAIDKVDQLGDELATAALGGKSLVTELLAMIADPVIWGLQKLHEAIGGVRLALHGGDGANADVNLENRIRELQDFIANPTGLFTWKQYEKAVSAARNELELLITKQEMLQNFGAGGLLNPKMEQIPIALTAPKAAQIEETNEDRDKRRQEDIDALRQRSEFLVRRHQIEQDLELKNQIRLGQIKQEELDREVEAADASARRRLLIISDVEELGMEIRRVFGLEEIKLEEIKNQSIFEIALGGFGALAKEHTKFAKAQQGLAIAQTIWSTAAGIMMAFQTLPWPANIIAATKVSLTGAIQVAKIRSTNYNAGSVSGSAPTLSGGSAVGSSSDSGTVDPGDTSKERGQTTVYINGMITRDILDYLVESLKEGFKRDVVVIPMNSLQAEIIRNGSY